jgi:glycosyltransferase involved in cell wall biosynthesis
MRIGLVIYGSLDVVSGGYLYDRKLVAHLQAAGDTVDVIALPWRNYARHLFDNGSRHLLNQMGEAAFDILLQDELNHPSLAWINRLVKRRSATPIVSIVHHLRVSEQHPAWQQAVYRPIERRYLSTIDAFIFNSNTTQQAVTDLQPDSAQKPSVVAFPAGDRFGRMPATHKAPSGPLRIVFVGNVIARKGLDTLLDAVQLLPENAWQLDVVGALDVDKHYVESIRPKLTHPGITVHGQVSDNQLAEILNSADVLVVPSQYEGFGIVYLEAMAFGCVAIGSTAGAATEIITDGVDGFLVPPEEPEQIANRLLMLLEDVQKLQSMQTAARRRFEQHPTWDATGASIRQFLLNLVG